MPATRITFKDAKEHLRDYFIALEKTSSFSLPIFICKSKDSDILKFLKTLLRSIDLSREQYYLSTKDSSNIKIGDLLKSKMIIFEKFGDEEYDIVRQIKDFKIAPFIPIIAFVETSDKNNIDRIYDVGVDLVVQKSMFFSQFESQKPDYNNITYFVQSINKLLIKSDVLQWFWQVSQEIIKNMDAKYNTGIKVILNQNIKSRIIEKLKIAFGHLKKPYTTYDTNYDFTNVEFSFLTYWSCINEILIDWVKEDYYKIELKNGNIIAKRSITKKDEFSSNFISKKITTSDDAKSLREANQRLADYYLYELKYLLTYEKSSIDYKGDKVIKQPLFYIPVILLSNNIENITIRAKFYILNQIRNNLAFTHSHSSKKTIKENSETVLYDNVDMINMLYLLLNREWKSVDSKTIQIVRQNIKRLLVEFDEGRKEKLMRFIGKIKEVNPNATDDKVLIILSGNNTREITEIRFQKGIISPDVLKSLSPNDNVEVFAKINSGTIENVYYQFIQLEDVIKIS